MLAPVISVADTPSFDMESTLGILNLKDELTLDSDRMA